MSKFLIIVGAVVALALLTAVLIVVGFEFSVSIIFILSLVIPVLVLVVLLGILIYRYELWKVTGEDRSPLAALWKEQGERITFTVQGGSWYAFFVSTFLILYWSDWATLLLAIPEQQFLNNDSAYITISIAMVALTWYSLNFQTVHGAVRGKLWRNFNFLAQGIVANMALAVAGIMLQLLVAAPCLGGASCSRNWVWVSPPSDIAVVEYIVWLMFVSFWSLSVLAVVNVTVRQVTKNRGEIFDPLAPQALPDPLTEAIDAVKESIQDLENAVEKLQSRFPGMIKPVIQFVRDAKDELEGVQNQMKAAKDVSAESQPPGRD